MGNIQSGERILNQQYMYRIADSDKLNLSHLENYEKILIWNWRWKQFATEKLIHFLCASMSKSSPTNITEESTTLELNAQRVENGKLWEQEWKE